MISLQNNNGISEHVIMCQSSLQTTLTQAPILSFHCFCEPSFLAFCKSFQCLKKVHHLTLWVNVKHIVRQHQLQWHLWSLHCILGTELVFSHGGITLDIDAVCIQEQGWAGESSQEQCCSFRERMALSSLSTCLHNHTAAKHIEYVSANIVPL